jgi:hypothetical protein
MHVIAVTNNAPELARCYLSNISKIGNGIGALLHQK